MAGPTVLRAEKLRVNLEFLMHAFILNSSSLVFFKKKHTSLLCSSQVFPVQFPSTNHFSICPIFTLPDTLSEGNWTHKKPVKFST